MKKLTKTEVMMMGDRIMAKMIEKEAAALVEALRDHQDEKAERQGKQMGETIRYLLINLEERKR